MNLSKTFSMIGSLLVAFAFSHVFAGSASMNPNFDTGLPVGFNNTVNSVLVQSNGKIVAGGAFTLYQSVSANKIARLNADGTKDYLFSVGSGFNGNINAMAFGAGEYLFVGGAFTNYNGTSVNRLVSLTSTGKIDISFDIGSGFNGDVLSLAVQNDGKVIVGGKFTSYQSTSVNRIVRLNVDGSLDSSFDVGGGCNNDVNTITIQEDGKILVGGSFSTYSGATSNRFVRLNADGTKDTSFSGGSLFNNIVYAITIQEDGKILVGGSFTTYSGATSNRFVRLNTDGTKDASFSGGSLFNNIVYAITIQEDEKILVGGSFTTYSGATSNRFVRLNTDGTKDDSLTSGVGFINIIKSIFVEDNGMIVLGGAFNAYSGLPANRIIRLNADGSRDDAFDTGNGFDAQTITVFNQDDGKILVGGSFSTYGGTTANYITRLNADGSKDTSFNAGGAGFNASAFDFVEQSDGKVVVGGFFTAYNGSGVNRMVRINADGSRDDTFLMGSAFNSSVFVLGKQQDDKILVGGLFTTYSGASQKYLVRLNADGTKDTSFDIGVGFNNEIDGLAIQQDGKILAGGDFTLYQGGSVNRLIRLNADGTKDTSFDIGSGFNAIIVNIVLQDDGKILVGGYYTDYNGTSANRLIRLNTDGSRDTSFDIGSGFNGSVNTIAIQQDGKILAGGEFTSFNNESANRLIRLNADGSRDYTFDMGLGCNDNVRDLIVKDDGQIVVAGKFTSYNMAPVGYLIFLYGESDVVVVPDTTDRETVVEEFTDKGYIRTNGDLDGSLPISLRETDGEIPVSLSLKHEDIKLSIPAETQFMNTSTEDVYDGIVSVPLPNVIQSVNDETVLSSFKAGSNSESLSLTGGVATLSTPVPTQNVGDIVQVWYSEDNGITWYPHIVTNVVYDAHGDEYANFNTDHFTDFAVTIGSDLFEGSFVLNDDDVSTQSKDITLTIESNPSAQYMRFSNDNVVRTDREVYSTSKERQLSGEAGDKTVYLELDLDGDSLADVYLTDTITFVQEEVDEEDPSDTTPGASGGGAGPVLHKDECPSSRDCSDSYYDKICGPCPVPESGHYSADSVQISGSIEGSPYTDELNDAYLRALASNVTSKGTIISADMTGTLIRSHMAKMISEFAMEVLGKKPLTGDVCSFADMKKETKEMQYYALVACQLGLMGRTADGLPNTTFNPQGKVTRAEFGTALSRLLYGSTYNTLETENWYVYHLQALKKVDIMKKIDTPFDPEQRGFVMLMMKRSVK